MTATQIGALLHGQRYRIRQQLGRGGFGAVYLADDTRLPGRQVALKENLNVNKESRQQFKREALLLARLHHPNLPQVTDYFADAEGRQFLVMDYIPGENLRQLMSQRSGPLPLEEVLAIADQVMQALAYMHTWRDPESGKVRPIIHRDVKPDNIKRTPDGRVLLVDFGIAKVDTNTETVLSARALTPGYAPIEQYGGGTDERSDVYALGATLYALLTGKTPPSSVDLAAGAALPPLRSNHSDIPAGVVKVIERAMKVNARDRYPSIEKMYLALLGRPLPTTPITTPTPRRNFRMQGSQFLPIGMGVVALLIVAASWWLLANDVVEDHAVETHAPVVNTATVSAQAFAAPTLPATAVISIPVTEPTGAPPPSTPDEATPASPPPAATQDETTVTDAVAAVAVVVDTDTPPPPASTEADAAPTGSVDRPEEIMTPEVTAVASPATTATRTPIPTSTPLVVSTPTATSTSGASAAPRPTARTITANAGGPRSVVVLQPNDHHAANTLTRFLWQSDTPLAPGQEYEVVFWRAQGGDEAGARGLVRSSTATDVMLPVHTLARDAYNWAIYLVQPQPYVRIRRLAGPFRLTIDSDEKPRWYERDDPTPARDSK